MYDDSVPLMRRLAVAGLTAVVGWGCGPDAPRDTTRLTVGLRFDYPTPNELIGPPTLAYAAINDQMFLSLMQEQGDFREGPPVWAPGLAEDWEFSEDRLQLTVRLRSDAKWSDGEPVTAEDVRFTWLAHTDSEVAWGSSYVHEATVDVEVLDPHTVRFHFDAALPTVLADVSTGAILPRHAWEARPFAEWRGDPDWFFDRLVTSGPFRLESRTPGSELVLGRNPDHFETDLPRLERVILRNTPDSTALTNRLLAGELDVATGIGATDASRIDGQPGLRLIAYSNRQFSFVVWNTTRPWFADAATRRSLALAIDRQAIVDTIWHGYARVGRSPVISGVWAHDPDLEPWPHDPEAARATLREAGWMDADGDGIIERGGRPFRFELATNTGAGARWDAMQMIQADLRAVGIDAQPRRVEPNALNQRLPEQDFDAAAIAIAIDTSLDFRPLFHSEEVGGYNFAGYANPEADRLIESFATRTDPLGGREDLHRLQRILRDDQPMLVLWEPVSLAAFNDELESVAPNAVSPLANLKEWAWR
ncbi:MAG: ABC transporter substrate-binding protein [Acidobacteria bacterium]|nr:ABC transporter substrate-binding protein [Acidobacteriota bacterium]MCY3965873.1 ABC transporter substrate-binding protein [Acidobacteriota bacterium]